MVDLLQTVPETSPPKHILSVIIPVLNGEATIAELLRSLHASSRTPDEIIVVDDGSTDRSAAIAASLGATVLATPG